MLGVFLIIQSFFVLGAFLFVLAKRRQGLPLTKGWNKFFVYMLIVNLISYSIANNLLAFRIIAVMIVVQGLFEISKALYLNKTSKSFSMVSLVIYGFLSFGFLMFSNLEPNLMVWTYLSIFLFDGFSQLSGQLFGKNSLAPNISPNKTIEGAIGGLIVTLSTLFFLDHISGFSPWESIGMGLLICFGALLGDLLASLLKRRCGIKDYGKILPGHGGILDRFDSFLFGGAMMYAFVQFSF